jgi:peptidyl-prolyl cis-trans isomerase SurA
VTLLVLLAFSAALISACSSQSTASDDVVAQVNGKEISTAELEKQYQVRINGAEQQPSPEEADALKFQLLGQMINDRILLEMAAAGGLTATDAEVDSKFAELKTQYTAEQFEEMLKTQKMSVDDIKSEMRKSLTIEKLVNKEITNRIDTSDTEISDFYEKNKESFNLPESFHLAHIMVTPVQDGRVTNAKRDDAKTPADAQAKASRLLREIQGGMDFGVVARDWSEDSDTAPAGGDLNFRALADLNNIHPKLAEAVQRLKVGETSSVIETPYGYHILKLIERDAGGQKDLKNPQVQAQIRQAIFNRKEEILRAAFSEVARNKAEVKNYLADRLLANSGKVAAPTAPAAAPAPAEKK